MANVPNALERFISRYIDSSDGQSQVQEKAKGVNIEEFPTEGASGEVPLAQSDGTVAMGGISGGGAVYVQNTSPSGPTEKETWYAPDTGIYRVYSNGAWRNVPPVLVTEETVTFAETDVTLTKDLQSEVTSNVVSLVEANNTQADRNSDDNTQDYSESCGLKLTANTDLYKIDATVSANVAGPPDRAFITDSSQNILDEQTGGWTPGDVYSANVNLTGGNTYYIGLYDDGTTWTWGQRGTTFGDVLSSLPAESRNIDIERGSREIYPGEGGPYNEDNQAFSFRTVTGYQDDQTGPAEATVAWDSGAPSVAEGWDLATFQRTLANETVTVDIVDSGGNVLLSDIGRNEDISTVATSTDVQVRVTLERSDTSNNPTFEYAARRYGR